MFDQTRETFKKYWEIARTTYEEEISNPQVPARTRPEREFLPAAIEVMDTPASPTGRIVTWCIIAFFVLTIIWAIVGKIDIHATLQGRLVPIGSVKVIEPLETGTVLSIHVNEGTRVKKGQLLLELDPTDSTVDRNRLAREAIASRTVAARLRESIRAARDRVAVIDVVLRAPEGARLEMVELHREVLMRTVAAHRARIASIDGEIAQHHAQLQRIANSVAERKKLVGVINERVEMYTKLLKSRTGTRSAYLQVAQLLYEERSNLVTESGQLNEVKAATRSLELRRDEEVATFLHDAVQQLAEVENEISRLDQELIKATRREARNRMHAPVAGVVRQLAVHTIGEVVTTDQQIMTIVPENTELEVEAMLLNKDKGFVFESQSVEVKLEAFPFTKFGTVDGEILDVSNDSVEQENVGMVFPVRISMKQNFILVEGERRFFTPGMSVTVEVKTGKRRVIEYLLTPLLRYRDEAIRER